MDAVKNSFLLLTLGVLPTHAAVTINWGNSISDQRAVVDNAGQAAPSSFVFELGYFTSGIPTGAPNTWRTQWSVLDTADYNQNFGFFSSSWTNDTNIAAGETASFWISNGDYTATPNSEWAILTSSTWLIPQASDATQLPVEFRVTDVQSTDELKVADTAIFGRLDDLSGQGISSAPPFPTTDIQLFTFVPEPSAAILSLLGGLALLHRKR